MRLRTLAGCEMLHGEWQDLGLQYCGLFCLGRPRTPNEQQCHDDDDDGMLVFR